MSIHKLFSWGANTYGQLGHGNSTDLMNPIEIESVPGINLSKIKNITGGGGHTVILTDHGNLFSCGWNNKGQLGIGDHAKNCETFKAVQQSSNISFVEVCCGWDFTLAISDSNTLYAWGSNEFQQLGIIDTQMCFTPTKVEELQAKKIVGISAGLRHTLALTGDNEVLSWGSGKNGELGLKDPNGKIIKKSVLPQKVSAVEGVKIKSVICGAYHSGALSFDGVLYLWGRNHRGQLGKDPKHLPSSLSPQLIAFDHSKISVVNSGWSHMICATDSMEVYTWGRCDYGQLGKDSIPSSAYDFKATKIFHDIKNVVIGAEHNLMIKDQKIWSWGWNEHGICGTGDEENVPIPQTIEALSSFHPILIGTGCGSSYAIVVEEQK